MNVVSSDYADITLQFGQTTCRFETSDRYLWQLDPFRGIASRPQGDGFWITSAKGQVVAFGAAELGANTPSGGVDNIKLNSPIISMAPSASGKGYYLLAADGGVFCLGDAQFFGSLGADGWNYPYKVVAMAPHPSGTGYFVVRSNGEVWGFPQSLYDNMPALDAAGHKDVRHIKLNLPIVGLSPTPSGLGLWLVGKNAFYGSLGGKGVSDIVGMCSTPSYQGYYLYSSSGKVYAFGDRKFLGEYASFFFFSLSFFLLL